MPQGPPALPGPGSGPWGNTVCGRLCGSHRKLRPWVPVLSPPYLAKGAHPFRGSGYTLRMDPVSPCTHCCPSPAAPTQEDAHGRALGVTLPTLPLAASQRPCVQSSSEDSVSPQSVCTWALQWPHPSLCPSPTVFSSLSLLAHSKAPFLIILVGYFFPITQKVNAKSTVFSVAPCSPPTHRAEPSTRLVLSKHLLSEGTSLSPKSSLVPLTLPPAHGTDLQIHYGSCVPSYLLRKSTLPEAAILVNDQLSSHTLHTMPPPAQSSLLSSPPPGLPLPNPQPVWSPEDL